MAETIKLTEGIDGIFCVNDEDGEKVFQTIVPLLKEGKEVCLSFEGVRVLTASFLNVAVGKLYGVFSEEEMRKLMLPPQNITLDDMYLLTRVVDNAKRYFKKREGYL